MVVSFVCLDEFGRLGTISINGKGPDRWITAALFAIACLGWVFGWDGLNASVRYALGLTGGFWTVGVLFLSGRNLMKPSERHSLLGVAALFSCFNVLNCLIVPKAPFLPALIIPVCGWFLVNHTGLETENNIKTDLHASCALAAASIAGKLVSGIDTIQNANSPRYIMLKSRLTAIRKEYHIYRFVNTMITRNGEIIFSVDSEPPVSTARCFG